MHAVLVLQQVGLHSAILAAAAAYNAVIAAIVLPILIAQRKQFLLPLSPVNDIILLELVEATGMTDALLVKAQRDLLGALTVGVLVAGHGLLVRHVA